MAKFLITIWSFPGHVHQTMAIGHALRARGHGVAFCTGARARPLVEEQGFTCFPFIHVNEERIYERMGREYHYYASRWDAIRHARGLKTYLREWLLDTIPDQIQDLDRALAAWQPDALLCDLSLWGPIVILHETRGVPVAVYSVAPGCMLPGPDTPPWGLGHPPPRNRRMRLRYAVQRQIVRWASADFRKTMNAVRHRYGLPPVDVTATELCGRMPLYLVPSAPEFDYERRDLPPSVRYVGPCLWDKPHDAPAPAWLASLPRDRPMVHVTEATVHVHEPFLLRAAARALADRPMSVVMTTGAHRDPEALGLEPLAPNIRLDRYVPHSDLLPYTAVVVTLGGTGTILSALSEGVPLVVVPTEWDKPENAARIEASGAGIRLAPKHCTPERLRAAVERVLSEPSFRTNARRLATAFSRRGGPARAAEHLENLAMRRPLAVA